MRGKPQLAKLKGVRGYRKAVLRPVVIILGVGGFYLLTIREGHDWGGDFAMFLQHAENITSGRPYAETTFVPDPEVGVVIGPTAYPPMFPLFLAAISYVGNGPDPRAVKVGVVSFFVLFLVAVAGVLRRRLSKEQAALVLAMVGLSPYFWNFKDQILSDIPFAFFLWLVLWLAELQEASEVSRARSVGLTALIGVVMYMATATRTLGITLAPTLVIYEALRYRKFPLRSTVSSLIAGALLAIQRTALDVDEGYLTVFHFDPLRFAGNFFEYLFSLKGLFWNGYVNGLAVAVWLMVTLLAFYGYRVRLRARFTLLEVFAAVYSAPLVLWPFYQGIRLLIPLVPLYLYYAVVGLTELRGRASPVVAGRTTAVLAVAVFGSFVAAYTRVDYRKVPGGIAEPEAVQLFDYVRENHRTTDLYVFFKPRVLAYYTGVRTTVNYQPSERTELWRFYDRVGASHVVVKRGDTYLEEVAGLDRERMVEVYRNPEFAVYAILHPGSPEQVIVR